MADGTIEIETVLETKEFEKNMGKLSKSLKIVSNSFGKVKNQINSIGKGFGNYIKGSNEVEKETEDMSKSFDATRAKIKELEREVRSTTRNFGKNSDETIRAKKTLNDYVLALDDATFKQVFMRNELGQTESQLSSQAGAIKINAKMIKLMGSETELLTQKMEGLQRHGVKPEDLMPKSTIGHFQMINETLQATGGALSKLSLGYRKLGNSVEGVIKKYSAQKIAIREANGDMVKYGLILRGLTVAQGNLALAIPIVGIVAGVAYKKMFDAALASDKKLKELSETVKGKVAEAFKPLIKVAGDFLEIVLKMVGKVADLIIKFNEAHPALAKILGVIGFLAPALVTLLLPLAAGVGLWKGWGLMINMAWTALGGIIASIGIATSTFFILAGAVTGGILAFNHFMKTNEEFNKLVTGLWEKLKAKANEVFNSISETISKTAENIVNAFKEDGIKGVLNEILNIFSNIGNFIVQSIPKVAEGINTFIVSILNIWAENSPKMWEMGMTLITSILNGINTNLPLIINTIVGVLNSILSTIITNLPLLINSGVTLLTGIINGITNALPTLLNGIINIVNSIVNIVVTNLPLIIDSGTKILLALVNGIVNSIPKLLQEIINLIPKIVQAIVNNLPKILEAGSKILISIVNGITKALPKLIDAALKLIPQIVKILIQNLPKILSMGGKIVLELAKGLINAIPSLVSSAASIGTEIVKGIWEGIKSMGSWLWDKVTGFFDNTIKTVKNFLGIKSPSRVMRDQVGKYMAQGIGVGFEKEGSKIKEDFDETIKRWTNNMRATVDFETSRVSAKVTSVSEHEASKNKPHYIENNNDNGVTQNINIYEPVENISKTSRTIKRMGRELLYGL